MAHNVALPKHIYCWVRQPFVYTSGVEDVLVPCVWFAISSHPGRALGCHVMLENGAVVLELPLHALIADSKKTIPPQFEIHDHQIWDCFGWDAEVFELPYLGMLSASILDDEHKNTHMTAFPVFAIDWKDNAFSDYPEQHKWLIMVETEDNYYMALPQDRLVFEDASFTKYDEGTLKRIKRQTEVWSCE